MQVSTMDSQNAQKKFWAKWFHKNFGFSFCMGFGATLLIHVFAFLNHVSNHDQVRNSFAMPASFYVGRWFTDTVISIGSRLSMPWFNGIMFALVLGLAIALMVDILQIKSRKMIALTAWAVASFYSVSTAVMHIYSVDVVGVSILLATLSVWVCTRWKFGMLLGIIPLTLSMGIYQGYWALAVSLLCIRGLQLLLKGELTDKQVIVKAVQYGIMLGAAVVCYLVVNRLALNMLNMEMGNYMGVNEMGNIPISRIPYLMKKGYLNFFSFIVTNAELDGGTFGVVAQCCIWLFILVGILVYTLRQKRTIFQYICIIGITAMLPLLFNTVHLMNSTSVHDLMVLSIVGNYLLAIWLADEWFVQMQGKKLPIRAVSAVAAIMVGFSCFHATAYANQRYYIYNLENIAAREYLSRVVYRIESNENYSKKVPVLFVGSVGRTDYGNVPYRKMMPRFQTEVPFSFLKSDSHIRGFLFTYLEVTFGMLKPEVAASLEASEAVRAMPYYPAADCIQLIDGVLVVKVGE